jgi:hypothetical protein
MFDNSNGESGLNLEKLTNAMKIQRKLYVLAHHGRESFLLVIERRTMKQALAVGYARVFTTTMGMKQYSAPVRRDQIDVRIAGRFPFLQPALIYD